METRDPGHRVTTAERGSSLGCPELKTCAIPITKYFFERFCHNGKDAHKACNYYCGRHGLLKPPMQWLQQLAVVAELKPPERWMYEHTRSRSS